MLSTKQTQELHNLVSFLQIEQQLASSPIYTTFFAIFDELRRRKAVIVLKLDGERLQAPYTVMISGKE